MNNIFALFPLLAVILCSATPATAAIELAFSGNEPATIAEVYQKAGTPYVAIDDVLSIFEISNGDWDSVDHRYHFSVGGDKVVIIPDAPILYINGKPTTIGQPPLFIDNRLRVPEEFLLTHLPLVFKRPIYYRNTEPVAGAETAAEEEIDEFFTYLMKRPDAASQERVKPKILLDPGHGGDEAGSIGLSGVREKDVNLQVASALEKALKMRQEAIVTLTRDGDYAISQEKRHETTRAADPDLLILLHTQASTDPAREGMTIYIRPEEDERLQLGHTENPSWLLAQQIGQAAKKLQLRIEGIRRAPLRLLGRGDLPTILIELGYLSNPKDVALLTDPEGVRQITLAIEEGVRQFILQERNHPRVSSVPAP